MPGVSRESKYNPHYSVCLSQSGKGVRRGKYRGMNVLQVSGDG